MKLPPGFFRLAHFGAICRRVKSLCEIFVLFGWCTFQIIYGDAGERQGEILKWLPFVCGGYEGLAFAVRFLPDPTNCYL